jgi:hypothetical protein
MIHVISNSCECTAIPTLRERFAKIIRCSYTRRDHDVGVLLFGTQNAWAVKKQAGSLFSETGEDACLPKVAGEETG